MAHSSWLIEKITLAVNYNFEKHIFSTSAVTLDIRV